VVISSRHPEAQGASGSRAIASAGEMVSFDGEVAAMDGHHTPKPPRMRSGEDVRARPWFRHRRRAVEEFGEADFCVLSSSINPALHEAEGRAGYVVFGASSTRFASPQESRQR
jgi:hypothetical protein